MKIVFYDTETTGTNPKSDHIIQIAALACENFTVIGEFEVKIKFNANMADREALKANSYDPVIWEKEAITERLALYKFDQFVQRYKDVERISKRTNKPFLLTRTGGHNVALFDDAFIRSMYSRYGEFCPLDYQEIYDTLALAKWVLGLSKIRPENWQQPTLCKMLGIDTGQEHDALSDVRACAELARFLHVNGINHKNVEGAF